MPIGIRTVRYFEYDENEALRSEGEAEALALYKLRLMLADETAEGELVSKKISGGIVGENYILRAEIECIENIALVKEIQIDGLP